MGILEKNSFLGGGTDVFWNYTMASLSLHEAKAYPGSFSIKQLKHIADPGQGTNPDHLIQSPML